MEYIAMQTGSTSSMGGAILGEPELVTVTSTGVTLGKEPATIGTICGLTDKIPVWFTKAGSGCGGSDDAAEIMLMLDADAELKHAKAITAAEIGGLLEEDASYCARYFTKESGAKMMKVAANFFPSEMVLILTANLYEGDANSPQNGKAAGQLTIKVPRYQLDGQFDMSMSMTSAATTSLNGVALAVNGGEGCSDEGYYAEIVQYVDGADFRDGLKEIVADTEVAVDKAPAIYGVYANGSIARLDNAVLTEMGAFSPALVNGQLASKPTTVKIPAKPFKTVSEAGDNILAEDTIS